MFFMTTKKWKHLVVSEMHFYAIDVLHFWYWGELLRPLSLLYEVNKVQMYIFADLTYLDGYADSEKWRKGLTTVYVFVGDQTAIWAIVDAADSLVYKEQYNREWRIYVITGCHLCKIQEIMGQWLYSTYKLYLDGYRKEI